MKRLVWSLLAAFIASLPSLALAQYEPYELSIPEELKTNGCRPVHLTDDEQVLWLCSETWGLTYRTNRSGTELYKDFSNERYNVVAWGGLNRYLLGYFPGYLLEELYRCDPDCTQLAPPIGEKDWRGLLQSGGGMPSDLLRFTPSGDILLFSITGNLRARMLTIPAGVSDGNYPTFDFEMKGSRLEGIRNLNIWNNDSGQFAYWAVANSMKSGLWDGTKMISMPRGIHKDFWPKALLPNGNVIGTMSDISWHERLYLVQGRKKKEININANKLFTIGSFIKAGWAAADNTALLVGNSRPKGRYFIYVEKGRARFLKHPGLKRVDTDGYSVSNACGSVVVTNYPYVALGTEAPQAVLLHKTGC